MMMRMMMMMMMMKLLVKELYSTVAPVFPISL